MKEIICRKGTDGMSENYAKIIEITSKQEELLRFDHFSSRDAWELGSFLVQRVFDRQLDMAISIRKLNGYTIFQYGTQNTTISNQQWMHRKFNTVSLTESSSLRAWATAELKGQTLESQGISSADYAFCGGGFPIRVKSGEIVAILLTSNLPHEMDHDFMIQCLKEWLDHPEVPNVRFE